MDPIIKSADTLFVGIGSGMYPEKGAVQFRVSSSVASDLVDSLRAADISVGPVPENSTMPWEDVVKFAAIAGGSLGGLAAVLSAFFGRHRHRSITLAHRGSSFEMKGMSPRETDELLQQVLGGAAAEQEELDKLWDELMEGHDGSEDDSQ